MTKEQEQIIIYSKKINMAIERMFDEGSEFYVDPNDFDDSEKLTMFMHAFATVAPCRFLNAMGNDYNHLDFNHTANKLCFQYTHLTDETTTPEN